MKNRRCNGLAKFWNGRSAWICAGFLVGAILFAGRLPEGRSGLTVMRVPLIVSNCPVSLERQAGPWYFRSGQWRADMRSLAALLRFLADSEKIEVVETNVIPAKTDNALGAATSTPAIRSQARTI